jgi:hypothetical protein
VSFVGTLEMLPRKNGSYGHAINALTQIQHAYMVVVTITSYREGMILVVDSQQVVAPPFIACHLRHHGELGRVAAVILPISFY